MSKEVDMKITLVQPPSLLAVDNYSTITQPPLGIAYLAAYARQQGHEVHVVDAVGEAVTAMHPWPLRKKRLIQGLSFEAVKKRIPQDSDVIGISCMFTHAWPMVRELMIEIKKAFPKARIIAGGEHVTSMYETVLRETPIDACVLGEGEETLGELLRAFEQRRADFTDISGIAFRNAAGAVTKTPRRDRISDPDQIPWPAWDLMDPMAYLASQVYMGPTVGRSMPLLATRGCPFECTFCSSANMWTQLWKPRDPVKVADEMQFYMERYGANDFQFQDLTAIVRKDWIVAFCNELLSRKLNITWQLPVGTRSEAIDAEVTKLLMASGCHHITYAPESGSERILQSIKKRVKLDRLEDSARAALDAGMRVCLFNIIGFPQEEMEDIKKSLAWQRHMAKVGVHEIAVSTFVPLPGTVLFEETNKIKPICVDDEYCHWMTGSTSLFTVCSWNPKISDRKLLFLKLWAMFQFYALSYFYHPSRLWQLIRNLFQKKQETKVDRVIQEFKIKFLVLIKAAFKRA